LEFLGLLAGALVALLVATLLLRGEGGRRRRVIEAEEGEEGGRVDTLCRRLGGDPARDRPLLNRILALGPGVIPELIEGMAAEVRDPEGPSPQRLARMEGLVADFGLAAVPPVTDALARLQPTAPHAPGLTRVLTRLGRPGVGAILRRGLVQPDLAPFLPRFRGEASDAVASALAQRPEARRAHDLNCVAGLLGEHPTAIDSLWDRWASGGRVELLHWLADWLPLARPEHIHRGLADDAFEVRLAAARLARLLVDPTLLGPLDKVAQDPRPEVRRAAVCALAAQPLAEARPRLAAAAADADTSVALCAIAGLLGAPGPLLTSALHNAQALPEPALAMLEAVLPLSAERERELTPLSAALESDDPCHRELAARILGALAGTDPRARERLIRLADGDQQDDRVRAVYALSFTADTTVAELLARALRETPDREQLVRLQEAAQRIGDVVVLPLARRLRPDPPGRVEASLAIVRVQPYGAATPPLLRGLEDARSGFIEGLVAATLAVGGEHVRERVYDALDQPSRGLLPPALRYLASYGPATDLPLLIQLFDRHFLLRQIILNLIEAQGAEAIPALEARIAAGGDDSLLAMLEQRHEILVACTPGAPE